jgi:hypothetical protein
MTTADDSRESDDALVESARAAIEQLADILAKDSIGSTDHVINAKTIALSDSGVVDRLVDLLAKGYRLKDITPVVGYGSSPLDFRLRFHLESNEMIDLPTADFTVLMELTTKSVRRILEPTEPISPSTVPLPFSLAIPSMARDFRTPRSELTNRLNREQAFFRRHPDIASAEPIEVPPATRWPSVYTSPYASPIDTNSGTGTDTAGTTDDSVNDIEYDVTYDFTTDIVMDEQQDQTWV